MTAENQQGVSEVDTPTEPVPDAKAADGEQSNTDSQPSEKPSKALTQEDIDRIFEKRWAKKMSSLEKELGAPISEIKTVLEKYRSIESAKNEELGKLSERLHAVESEKLQLEMELAALRAESLRAKLAREAGLSEEWIPDIRGTTEEEIRESIQDIKKRHRLGSIGIPTPSGAQSTNTVNFNRLFLNSLKPR